MARKRKQHSVLFSVPERPLKYADLIIVVRHTGEKIGELRISQGGLDWRAGKAKRTRKLSWERFIRLIAEH